MAKAKYKTITIKVTETSIRKGIQGSCFKCPIARAVHGAGFRGAEVPGDCVTFADFYTAPLPKRAQRFVRTFDDKGRKAVKPFTFKLRIPLKALNAA